MSNLFSFRKASQRNTLVYWLNIFGVRVLVSYTTPVAFISLKGRFRRGNDWGPTTRRHMRETGVYDWEIIESEDQFNTMLDAEILARILRDKDLVKKLTVTKGAKMVKEVARELG